jgi:Ca2+-binding EF-hand superfamily protein
MTADSKDIEVLKNAFTKIDKDSTGTIEVKKLKDALVEANLPYEEAELNRIISEVDYLGTNKINYTEFLAATVSVKNILTNERLIAMF